ncbi:MAG TPA: hypothetical protein PKO06_03485 [Candidatus Ozemobacteraceae bacterium]|nr:hypothetical protein [Candidatus Ozemobacteraceae bacterium]
MPKEKTPATKPRIPKPPKTPSVDALITAVPFLNLPASAPPDELWKAASVFLSHFDNEAVKRFGKIQAVYYAGQLREARDFTKQAIASFVWTPGPFRFPSELAFKGWQDDVGSLRFNVRLDFSSQTVERYPEFPAPGRWGELMTMLRALLMFLVLDAAQDEVLSLYLGYCRKCGKVFEKTRGDQEYCSKACKSATTQKRYDDKQRRS